MIVKRAVIQWVAWEEGGRTAPPSGSRYSAPVRFMGAREPWPPKEGWDLVVDMVQSLGGPHRWLADVHFRVEEAPHQNLVDGAEFELYEGWRCVARGRIEEEKTAM